MNNSSEQTPQERSNKVISLMNNFLEKAKHENYHHLDKDTSDKVELVFLSEIWGYRELILTIVIGRLLDEDYKASIELHKCHPRSIYEGPIRSVLSENSIPHRQSGILNIAKGAYRIDEQWISGKRDPIVPSAIVELVKKIDKMPKVDLENFAIVIHAEFLKIKLTAISVAQDDYERLSSQEPTSIRLIRQLDSLSIGHSTAYQYQRLIFQILKYLFEDTLVDGKLEEPTIFYTERRDIIFINEGENSFWRHVLNYYKGYFVMFETKNVQELTMKDIDQVATYIGKHLGSIGFLITRKQPGQNIVLKTYAVCNHSGEIPPKTILILSDNDIKQMISLKQEGQNPNMYMRNLLREFVIKIQ
ncbi:hypothetical protein KDA_36110 [Dictyobacter alpinus]|uniref:Restriction endonuclease n=1 Tax=Dictyobacter alpinus TaxID=2014873 RepID=A0A402B9Y9_9CHLR|nr:hypothetical protein [Dictyobacter alpinus]GCE28127.1 hypothetical protein KDA_36110 [Dictyobacter alpinus]